MGGISPLNRDGNVSGACLFSKPAPAAASCGTGSMLTRVKEDGSVIVLPLHPVTVRNSGL